VRFHRNGVAGESFHAVTFHDPESAEECGFPADTVFVGIVPSPMFDARESKRREMEFYVVTPAYPFARWRGDRLAKELLRMIAETPTDEIRSYEDVEVRA